MIVAVTISAAGDQNKVTDLVIDKKKFFQKILWADRA